MDHIVWADRSEPSKFVDAEAEQGVWPERARLDRQPHSDRRGVPARGCEAPEHRALRGPFVEMVGLGIEFRREPLNVVASDALLWALEAHAENKIIEPLNHQRPRLHGHGIQKRD